MRTSSTYAQPTLSSAATGIVCRLAALAFAGLFLTADPAAAEGGGSDGGNQCPTGLMRRADAGTGTLLLKTSTPGCYLGAPRVAADINVDIAGPVSRTRVTQRFENPSDQWIEGVYLFPLPDGAAVDTLRMQVGDRFIEGAIKERQEARQIYEQARDEGRVASLVEEDRPNVFTNQVANIAPHAVVVVQIQYQESLAFDRGQYHLRVPLVVAPRYTPQPAAVASNSDHNSVSGFQPVSITTSEPLPPVPDAPVLRPEWGKTNPVRLTVNLQAGFALGDIRSASHAVTVARDGSAAATITLKADEVPADRDFTLDYGAASGAVPQVSVLRQSMGGEDYVLALIVPPTADRNAVVKPRETIFVLDNSGSMGGESIRQAKAGLLLGLDRLTPADTFNVIRFDDTLTVLFPQAVPATPKNIAYAKGYVSGLDASGGTEMLPALLAALTDPTPNDTSHLRQVIFLTDGEVTNEAQLFEAIASKLGRTRLFTVGIGSAPNAYFMGGAARAGRGTYTYIGALHQVTQRMNELFAKLQRPVMTDLAATWPGSNRAETWPNPLPDLYAGEPVVISAKMATVRGSLILTGNLGGKPWRTTVDLAQARVAQGIERLWARNKIASLEESRVHGADPDSIDKQVLSVALAHHLTSRLTSLVAVDVTPSRPANEILASHTMPLNLPAGWDFDTLMGERPRLREASISTDLLKQLAPSRRGSDAASPQAEELDLPQGGTESDLLMLIGLLLFTSAFAVRCLPVRDSLGRLPLRYLRRVRK